MESGGGSKASGPGGGIANTDNASLVLVDTVVQHNSADEGGGIYSDSTQPVTIVRSRVEENSASLSGGGLFLGVAGNAAAPDNLVVRSLFAGNRAELGGGGVAVFDASLRIANTTLSGNHAPAGFGDNLTVPVENSSVVATNVTFVSENTAANLANAGSLSLQNSIIRSSQGSDCLIDKSSQPLLSLGNNVSGDDSCAGLGAQQGDLINTDALLAPLTDNGGATRTHALQDSSPAIDAGDDAACAAAPVGGLDQRGATRPFGFGCDIGAHEQGAPIEDLLFSNGFESP